MVSGFSADQNSGKHHPTRSALLSARDRERKESLSSDVRWERVVSHVVYGEVLAELGNMPAQEPAKQTGLALNALGRSWSRNHGRPWPPPQIRTSGTTASGSHLG